MSTQESRPSIFLQLLLSFNTDLQPEQIRAAWLTGTLLRAGRRGFILATVLVHLPTPNQMAEEVKLNAPDLSIDHARSSITGYIYGVTPGLAIPIVFGLTRPFRQTMYKRLVPKRWQNRVRNNGEITRQAAGMGRQAAAPVAPPLEAMQNVPWGPGGLGPTGDPRQDWANTIQLSSPKATDEDSFDLIKGTSRQEQSGMTGERDTGMRPGLSNSTASLDSLLILE